MHNKRNVALALGPKSPAQGSQPSTHGTKLEATRRDGTKPRVFTNNGRNPAKRRTENEKLVKNTGKYQNSIYLVLHPLSLTGCERCE